MSRPHAGHPIKAATCWQSETCLCTYRFKSGGSPREVAVAQGICRRIPSPIVPAADRGSSVIGASMLAQQRQPSPFAREIPWAWTGDRVGRLLLAYAVGWTLVNLAPFDLTLDIGDLGRRGVGICSATPACIWPSGSRPRRAKVHLEMPWATAENDQRPDGACRAGQRKGPAPFDAGPEAPKWFRRARGACASTGRQHRPHQREAATQALVSGEACHQPPASRS